MRIFFSSTSSFNPDPLQLDSGLSPDLIRTFAGKKGKVTKFKLEERKKKLKEKGEKPEATKFALLTLPYYVVA